jgi:protocatechuate 3,4-dioxygenase beta subunit
MTALDLALCFINTGLLLLTTAAHTCPHDTPTLRLTARQATCVSSMFAPTPTQVEGPFYLTSPVRADITEGRVGAPLRVTVAVKDRNCRSLSAGTRVAIWHADSKGVYSGFRSKPDNEGKIFDERGTTFLRGELAVDEDGKAVFDTIVPGWYSNVSVSRGCLSATAS